MEFRQPYTPLYDVHWPALQLVHDVSASLDRLPPSFSVLPDQAHEETLLMNVTRELSIAFTTAEIASLVDDRQGGKAQHRRDRVRIRRRRLSRYPAGYSETWFIPAGYTGR